MKVDFCELVNSDLTYNDSVDDIISKDNTNSLVATLEISNLIGWKYSPDQPKPKRRGSAEINLKDLSSDLLNENPDEEIKFGRISLKEGIAPEEEDYEIIEETERLKKIIANKLGEEKLKERLKHLNEQNKGEEDDIDKK